MPQRTAYVFIFDGFADWEPASALAELRRTFGFATKAIGLSREPVVSMGGLRVVPDLALLEFEPDTAAILILPGAEFWMPPRHPHTTPVFRPIKTAHHPPTP